MILRNKDALDIGLVVADIEASLRFYRDLLGLTYQTSIPVPFGTLHILQFGASAFKLVDPTNLPVKGTVGLEKSLGFRYVTFEVQNLSELCSELAAAGVSFAMPEQQFRPGVRIAMAYDPDENMVEFVERSAR